MLHVYGCVLCSRKKVVMRVVLIWIPNRTRSRLRTSHTQCVTICYICDGHKMSQLRICDLGRTFWIFLELLSKPDLVTFVHKWSHIQMRLVQPCLCLLKSSITYQKVISISDLCLESESERLRIWYRTQIFPFFLSWVLSTLQPLD